MKIIFVSNHNVPLNMGSGGKHRAYQILFELQRLVGEENVELLVPPAWRSQDKHFLPRLLTLIKYFWMKLSLRFDNPYKVACFTRFSVRNFLPREFLVYYQKRVAEDRPDICIIEDPRFAKILEVNRKFGIPTIAAFQNLESLDSFPSTKLHKFGAMRAVMGDLADELAVLRSCDDRLFISQIETGFVTGLGFPSTYFPYLPVGIVEERFRKIQEARRVTSQDPKLFLLFGSASHSSTGEAFQWVIHRIRETGLPNGISLVAIGKHTDQLQPSNKHIPSFRALGWVDDEELWDYLVKCQAVLIPQFRGFGALTRISELALAGIPVITSPHVTYAIDLPPNVITAYADWQHWLEQMEQVTKGYNVRIEQIDNWYRVQNDYIRAMLPRLIPNGNEEAFQDGV